MRRLLKERSGNRCMPALRLAVKDAKRKGYAHSLVKKASDVVEWATSPAAVVLTDQASTRLASKQCDTAASACADGSTALVVRHSFGWACSVAGCLDVSIEKMVAARVAAAAGFGGQDDHAIWATAVENKCPFLWEARDLRSFNDHLAVVAKSKLEVGTRAFRFSRRGTPWGLCGRCCAVWLLASTAHQLLFSVLHKARAGVSWPQ